MARSVKPSPLHRVLETLTQHPARLLEWLQLFCLLWILLKTVWNLGGYVLYGQGLVDNTLWICVLGILHAVYLLMRHDRVRVHPLWWWPLPFLCWASFNALVLSPDSVTGLAFLWSWWQAYLIYWVVLHIPRTPEETLRLYWILLGAFILGIVGLVGQFYLYPLWFEHPARPAIATDLSQGTGFFRDAEALAVMFVVLLPFFFIGSMLNRLSGPLRILLAFMVIGTFNGLLVTLGRGGLAAFALSLLLLPWLAAPQGRKRRRLIWLLPVGFVLLGAFSWLVSSTLDQQLESMIPLFELSRWWPEWQSIIAIGKSEWLTGTGLGSLGYLSEVSRSGPGYPAVGDFPASGWLSLWAQLGIIGLVLVLVPLAILLQRGWKAWKGTPFYRIHADDLNRHKREGRRSGSRKNKGKAPLSKVLLGSLWSGVLLLAIAFIWAAWVWTPAILWVAAVIVAMLSWSIRDEEAVEATGLRPRSRLPAAVFTLVLAMGPLHWSLPVWAAHYHQFEADRIIAEAEANPGRIFNDPGFLSVGLNDARAAVKLAPGFGAAWLSGARLQLLHIYAELEEPQVIAQRASDWIDRAEALSPSDWRVYAALADAARMMRMERETIVSHWKTAIDLAPSLAEPRIRLAEYLYREGNDTDGARMWIKAALDLEPSDPTALNWGARLGLAPPES